MPTRYKGYDHVGKVDLCKESTKKNGGSAFFEIIGHYFSEREEEDICSQISLYVPFTYRKANSFIKMFKLHGKW